MSERDTKTDERARDVFALYVDLLGPATAARALNDLEAGLRRVFIAGQPSNDELGALAAETHALVSTATAVGFLAVARACRDVEDRCGTGAARAAFAHARQAAVAALADIGRLRRELRAGCGMGGQCGRRNGHKERIVLS